MFPFNLNFNRKYTFAAFVLLMACTGQSTAPVVPPPPTPEVEEKIEEPIANTPIDTHTNYTYSWLQENNQTLEPNQILVNRIAVPRGYQRTEEEPGSYEDWLRHLPLMPPNTPVLLFDGRPKNRQDVHAGVINIDVGKRDLQQCADAVMRLRAEYLYGQKAYDQIHFNYTSGHRVSFDDWRQGRKPKIDGNKVVFSAKSGKPNNSYANFKAYMTQIFNYAGTASLSKELPAVPLADMQIGDVLIQGGFPGHAVIVVDMAVNEQGEKLFLLAQSYMPAQNIHILKNYSNPVNSPWYTLKTENPLSTPEWSFTSDDLHRFVR